VRLQNAVRIADQPGMATISAFRSAVLLLLTMVLSVSVARAESAAKQRTLQPVAYYDVDEVMREAHGLDPAWQRVAAIEERSAVESATLRSEVDELRTLLADETVRDPQRRVFETQLAERTIALLLLRSDSMRDIAAARLAVVDDVDLRIAAAVGRLAREQGHLVVIRTDRATRVLDADAIDLTSQVVAELGREVADTRPTREPAPAEPRPSEQRRTRLQACAGERPSAIGTAACAASDPADSGS
jgi:Skp family chaperone for outer membrane proteins